MVRPTQLEPNAPGTDEGQTGNVDHSTALDSIDLESSRFLVAVSNKAAALGTPLPTCPGWDVAYLVKHLGLIYSQVALVVSGRQTVAPDRGQLSSVANGEARLGWFAEQRTAVLAALEATDDDVAVWNWTKESPGPTRFWSRRLAHETLIHRVDLELAQGFEPAHAYPEVASDTVTEFFELFYPRFESQFHRGEPRGLPAPSRDRRARRGMDCGSETSRLLGHT